ncbi:MAG TPA: VWA domain-containing protein [Vicinamibacterales bacterium]
MIRGAVFVVAIVAVAAPNQQTFRAGVDAVRVDVQVTRNGQPVANLTSEDFELKDSGVVQRIEAVSLEQQPVDVLFALDASQSMEGERLARLKEAAHAAVGILDAQDRLAVLTFSQVLSRPLDWTSDRAAAGAAIDALAASGNTSLEDAALGALTLRQSARGRMLAIVFSDGLDTASWLDPLRVIDQARQSDLVIDAVMLDLVPDDARRRWFQSAPGPFRDQFLPALAAETGGDVLTASGADLTDAFVRIVHLFKTRYVLSYVPKGVPPDGWHPITVRLTHRKADVHARRGYQR